MADKFCESCEFWSFTYPNGSKKWGTCENMMVQEMVTVTKDEETIDDPTIMTENTFGCIYHESKDQGVVVRMPKM